MRSELDRPYLEECCAVSYRVQGSVAAFSSHSTMHALAADAALHGMCCELLGVSAVIGGY